MIENPPLTVILPVYNGERYLREAVASVLAQTHQDFEFLIWDDASTDSSAAILDSLSDPRIKRVKNPSNKGLFPTLNLAIRAARGQRLRFWTQDDRMRPGCLEREVAFWDRYPEIGMSFCACDRIDADGKSIDAPQVPRMPDVVQPWLAAQIFYYEGCVPANISTVTARKDLVLQLGSFAEMRQGGDFDMWERITRTHPLGYIREALIELRVHDAQLSRRKSEQLDSIHENRQTFQHLLERVPGGIRAHAEFYFMCVVGIKRVHFMMKALLKGDFAGSRRYFAEARREGSVSRTFLRWLLSGNGRWFRPRPIYIDPATGENAGPAHGTGLFCDVQEFVS